MRLGNEASSDQRMPRLAADCDPTSLPLTPSEGYLLSRIDGVTPWTTLRQIGGLPPAEVDRCLERWLKDGVIEVDGAAPAPPRPPAPAPPEASAAKAAAAPGAPAIDPALQIDVEIQREVGVFLTRLDRPYHEILGVPRDADARTIKKAYFGLSKRFHPDRYFRKDIGPYARLVERCFKKLLEAYELLSDPTTRVEVERSQSAASEGEAQAARASAVEAGKRLRRRLSSLTGHRRVLAERRRKAKGFFESGMAAFARERWLEAAGSVRLAIAFDPSNEAYREHFSEVQRKAHAERATVLLKQAESALDTRAFREALDLFEEVIHYRPYDAELHFRAARIAWQAAGELKRAKDLAASACELEPDNALYRRTLGQVYAAAGLASNARRELQTALKLDPNDSEAKSALRSL